MTKRYSVDTISGETWWTNYRRFNLSHFVDDEGQAVVLNFGRKNFIHGSDSPTNDFLPVVGMAWVQNIYDRNYFLLILGWFPICRKSKFIFSHLFLSNFGGCSFQWLSRYTLWCELVEAKKKWLPRITVSKDTLGHKKLTGFEQENQS